MLKTLKILFMLHKGWTSGTLTFARVFTFLPALDASFFNGKTGQAILEGAVNLVHMAPWWADVTPMQVMSFLVVAGGSAVAWLRQRTTVPIETKMV